MIGLNFFRSIPTPLEINGPILSFTSQPQSLSFCGGGIATFTGIATAQFPIQSPANPAENTGIVTYRWYEVGVGPLTQSTTVFGVNSNSLTITSLRSPEDNGRQFYIEASYIPSAYGIGKSTANAINEPINSDIIILNINPIIGISAQPSSSTVAQGVLAEFNIFATTTELTTENLRYQWQLNGKDLSDGYSSSTTSYTTLNNTYTSDTTVTIPSNAYGVQIIIAGSAGSIPGAGRYGVFTLPDGGRTLNLTVNTSSTGKGGSGGSPAGGSGGSASAVFDVGLNSWIIIAGGGAGGVGSVAASCSGNPLLATYRSVTPVYSGSNASAWSTSIGTLVSGDNGSNGALTFESCPGGDEGYYQNAGSGGTGGGSSISGGSAYNSSVATLLTNTEALNNLTGYITISYNTPGSSLGGSTAQVINTATISGSTTPNLKISNTTVGSNALNCVISHPTACNSPIYSNPVIYKIVSARSIINYELLDGSANQYGFGSSNLFDQPVTFTANPSTWTRTLIIYPPEKDITVKMTMAAAAGASRNGNRGGEGGISVFTFILRQNQEYVLKLGAQTLPSGGSNGGGGGAFLYRKGQLLVALGGGGGAGSQGRGGDGGGVSVGGENGVGRNSGSGGTLYSVGSLPVQGFFAGGATSGGVNYSATTGGRVSSCSIGDYWAQQGIAPCNDIGNVQFRGTAGQVASSSAFILRGYKDGTGYRNNGGNASGDNGGGGSGAAGGNAGTGSGSGGGGGSGYSNGEVNIITTRLGGSVITEAYAKFELVI